MVCTEEENKIGKGIGIGSLGGYWNCSVSKEGFIKKVVLRKVKP